MEAKKSNSRGNQVVVKKFISASREIVFEAWTNPEIMQHWYVGAKGFSKATVDLIVGGKYTNEMFLEGKESPDGKNSFMHYGEYLEIIKSEKLVFTWNSHAVKNTIVTVEFREVDSGTEVTVTHELSTLEEYESHNEGWNFALSNLEFYL